MNNTEIEKISNILQKYIDATYNADIPLLESVFHKEARISGYLGNQLLIGTPQKFIEDMSNQPSMKEKGDPYKAEITSLAVTGRIANAVVYETGFWGMIIIENHFSLVCEDGKWQIISMVFTTIE